MARSVKKVSRKSKEEDSVIESLEQYGTFGLRGAPFSPKTPNQRKYEQAILSKESIYVFAKGPAGSGKTYAAVTLAIQQMASGKLNQIVITRPAKAACDEELGFLPGELNEKFQPYLAPILEVLQEHVHRGIIDYLLKYKRIEAVPLAFMRGRTFKQCMLIVDEAQNTTPEQMKMILTRTGNGTKVIINGDESQSDIRGMSGLQDGIARIGHLSITRVIHFHATDCVRSTAVQQVLDCYE